MAMPGGRMSAALDFDSDEDFDFLDSYHNPPVATSTALADVSDDHQGRGRAGTGSDTSSSDGDESGGPAGGPGAGQNDPPQTPSSTFAIRVSNLSSPPEPLNSPSAAAVEHLARRGRRSRGPSRRTTPASSFGEAGPSGVFAVDGGDDGGTNRNNGDNAASAVPHHLRNARRSRIRKSSVAIVIADEPETMGDLVMGRAKRGRAGEARFVGEPDPDGDDGSGGGDGGGLWSKLKRLFGGGDDEADALGPIPIRNDGAPIISMRVFRVQAVAAFGGVDGGGGDQLTFQTSDVIELHVERSDGWSFGRLLRGRGRREGWFPSAFVERVVRSYARPDYDFVEAVELDDDEDDDDNGGDEVVEIAGSSALDASYTGGSLRGGSLRGGRGARRKRVLAFRYKWAVKVDLCERTESGAFARVSHKAKATANVLRVRMLADRVIRIILAPNEVAEGDRRPPLMLTGVEGVFITAADYDARKMIVLPVVRIKYHQPADYWEVVAKFHPDIDRKLFRRVSTARESISFNIVVDVMVRELAQVVRLIRPLVCKVYERQAPFRLSEIGPIEALHTRMYDRLMNTMPRMGMDRIRVSVSRVRRQPGDNGPVQMRILAVEVLGRSL